MLAGSERVMRETRMFSRQVDAATVDPAFVASVRTKRALSISVTRRRSSVAGSRRFP